jgi:ribose transport system substrate-binding protein
MRKIIVILSIVMCLILVTACEKSNRPKIGFSIYDMKFDFFKEMEKGTRTHLKELGYEIIVHDQKSNTERQISGCKELISKGVEVLIVSPINSTVMSQIVDVAHLNNIPVIINDVGGGGANYDAFIVSDCIGGGRLAGEYLKEEFISERRANNVNVVILRNSPEVSAAYSRGDGFLEIASECRWSVIADMVAEGEYDSAYSIMKQLLNDNNQIDAVFCTNDPMALGVSYACKELGKEGIKIIGFNGDIEALKAIREGKITATIQQYPYAMGEIAADLADMLIKKIDVDFDLPDEKTILVPVTLIDKNNVEDAFRALH